MNYKKIYQNIIDKRKLETPEGYTETHHILPRSLGGSDDTENLIKLTAREHFICHYLLSKMFDKETNEWYKMNHAFMMMKCQSICHKRYFNSRLYDALRTNFSSVMSIIQTGKNNSQYGKVRCVPNDALDCKNHVGYFPNNIPDGWITTKEWKNKKREENSKKDKFCKKCNEKIKTGNICDACKRYLRAPHYKIIDDNFEKMKEYFLECGSLVKTLEYFGIDQQTRKGNSYLSKKLKNTRKILIRRNSKPL